jgi:uncharacterized membrane protein
MFAVNLYFLIWMLLFPFVGRSIIKQIDEKVMKGAIILVLFFLWLMVGMMLYTKPQVVIYHLGKPVGYEAQAQKHSRDPSDNAEGWASYYYAEAKEKQG